MISLHSTLAAARFELRRGFNPGRLAILAALASFPPCMMMLLVWVIGADLTDFQSRSAALVFYYTIPGVVCLLGMLQWATPAIHSELEGRTWNYIAVRPAGAGSVLIGKYLAAVGWTVSAAMIALTLSLAVAQPRDLTRVWLVFAGLSFFSATAYGALFLFLGVLFLKRAVFIAVIYVAIMEVLVSLVPAAVNQLTIQYRLRGVMHQWLAIDDLGDVLKYIFADTPAWIHLTVLAVATVVLLTASLWVVRRRQFVGSVESRT